MKTIIWGAGENGKAAASILNKEDILYFIDIDKDKIGFFINGIQIKSVDALKTEKSDEIQVVYTVKSEEIIKQLDNWGGTYYYIEEYFSIEEVVKRIDRDLWNKYVLDKGLVKYTYTEKCQNWFREEFCCDLNRKLVGAMSIGDIGEMNKILQDVYGKNTLYKDELLINRPGMRLANRIINSYGRNMTVADYACGHGELIKKLAKDGHKTYAIDGSSTRIESLTKHNVNAIVGDVMSVPFESESFDFITCMECLEHVENVIKAKEEIYRTLKIGGIAIISVPYLKKCEYTTHVRQFDQSKLMSLFRDGFEVINLLCIPYLNWTYDDNLLLVARKVE